MINSFSSITRDRQQIDTTNLTNRQEQSVAEIFVQQQKILEEAKNKGISEEEFIQKVTQLSEEECQKITQASGILNNSDNTNTSDEDERHPVNTYDSEISLKEGEPKEKKSKELNETDVDTPSPSRTVIHLPLNNPKLNNPHLEVGRLYNDLVYDLQKIVLVYLLDKPRLMILSEILGSDNPEFIKLGIQSTHALQHAEKELKSQNIVRPSPPLDRESPEQYKLSCQLYEDGFKAFELSLRQAAEEYFQREFNAYSGIHFQSVDSLEWWDSENAIIQELEKLIFQGLKITDDHLKTVINNRHLNDKPKSLGKLLNFILLTMGQQQEAFSFSILNVCLPTLYHLSGEVLLILKRNGFSFDSNFIDGVITVGNVKALIQIMNLEDVTLSESNIYHIAKSYLNNTELFSQSELVKIQASAPRPTEGMLLKALQEINYLYLDFILKANFIPDRQCFDVALFSRKDLFTRLLKAPFIMIDNNQESMDRFTNQYLLRALQAKSYPEVIRIINSGYKPNLGHIQAAKECHVLILALLGNANVGPIDTLLDRIISDEEKKAETKLEQEKMQKMQNEMEDAIKDNKPDILKALLSKGNVPKQELLNLALSQGSLKTVYFLLYYGNLRPTKGAIDFISSRTTTLPLLQKAIENCNIADVVELISLGVLPDEDCLISAIESQRIEIVECLLKKGHIKPSSSCLMLAIESHRERLVRLLLEHGAVADLACREKAYRLQNDKILKLLNL